MLKLQYPNILYYCKIYQDELLLNFWQKNRTTRGYKSHCFDYKLLENYLTDQVHEAYHYDED